MKKSLLLIVAAVGVVFFTSCDKLPSLAGTRWVTHTGNDGEWAHYELSFTATHATYTETHSSNNNMIFTGTYTYDSPNVKIVSNSTTFFGEPPTGTLEFPFDMIHEGIVNRKTMEIELRTFPGEVMHATLTRQ